MSEKKIVDLVSRIQERNGEQSENIIEIGENSDIQIEGDILSFVSLAKERVVRVVNDSGKIYSIPEDWYLNELYKEDDILQAKYVTISKEQKEQIENIIREEFASKYVF